MKSLEWRLKPRHVITTGKTQAPFLKPTVTTQANSVIAVVMTTQTQSNASSKVTQTTSSKRSTVTKTKTTTLTGVKPGKELLASDTNINPTAKHKAKMSTSTTVVLVTQDVTVTVPRSKSTMETSVLTSSVGEVPAVTTARPTSSALPSESIAPISEVLSSTAAASTTLQSQSPLASESPPLSHEPLVSSNTIEPSGAPSSSMFSSATSTIPTATSAPKPDQPSKPNIGLIAGIGGGSICAIIAVIVLWWCFRSCKKEQYVDADGKPIPLDRLHRSSPSSARITAAERAPYRGPDYPYFGAGAEEPTVLPTDMTALRERQPEIQVTNDDFPFGGGGNERPNTILPSESASQYGMPQPRPIRLARPAAPLSPVSELSELPSSTNPYGYGNSMEGTSAPKRFYSQHLEHEHLNLPPVPGQSAQPAESDILSRLGPPKRSISRGVRKSYDETVLSDATGAFREGGKF